MTAISPVVFSSTCRCCIFDADTGASTLGRSWTVVHDVYMSLLHTLPDIAAASNTPALQHSHKRLLVYDLQCDMLRLDTPV
jgi:hypothetical protein